MVPEKWTQWLASIASIAQQQWQAWPMDLLWIYSAFVLVAGIAYCWLAVALLRLARRHADFPLRHGLFLFAVVILMAGCAHMLSLWAVWNQGFWPLIISKALTAAAAAVIALVLWPLIPKALRLPASKPLRHAIARLEHEVHERKRAEEALRQSQEILRELVAHQERIKEDERKRIAREIHDELGQNLLALRLDVSALYMRTGEAHPLLQQRAALALEQIDTTMKSIRTIMNNLRPPVLDLGLHAAIEWQVRQFEQRNGIPCDLLMSEDGLPVPDAQATAVFRILQESLTNIGRHARASCVRIELRIDDRKLIMAIKDNGVGMYPADRRKARSFGLVGIRERAVALGGEFAIDSAPGQGTVVRLTIPIEEPARPPASVAAVR